ncbi:hypothetical protein ACSAZL_06340 [Methanosarcina sp. T3]|uniref:hypothetical protein n=1 Tax=Methanosarcina sp. T3 TaxID=3439062 RepID=UPI003F868B57
MRYKILIFDDDEEWIDGTKDDFVSIVENEGFMIDPDEDIDYFTNSTGFSGNFDTYDMILVDFDLRSEHGNEIIERIRKHQHYTDVIFYTQGDEELSTFLSPEVQGIYWTHRRQLIDKFTKIFYNSIKKILDLNNLRGLVMAEVSELDKLKGDIVALAMKQELINESFFRSNLYPIVIGFCKANHKKANKYAGKDVNFSYTDRTYEQYNCEHFINNHNFFNVELKKKALAKLFDALDPAITFDETEYQEKIQQKRNRLAHEPEYWEDDKQCFGEYVFTHEEAKTIFKDIAMYKNIFQGAIRGLQSGEYQIHR